jgi:glycosyltransferase involved in cell wall biosynthesis
MRIAQVAPLFESVPPRLYGGTERVVSYLTEALVAQGHDVTLFATADSLTRARLVAGAPHGLRLDGRSRDHEEPHRALLDKVLRRSDNFDVIHFHNVSLIGGPGVLSYGAAVKLYTAHEHWLVCPMHTLWRHGREICTGRECLRCAFAYKRPPQLWRAGNLLARRHAISTPSSR